MCKAFPASPPTWGRGATEIRKGLWRCDGNDPGEGRWGGHCTSEAGLAPPPTAGLTLKTVGTLASLEAGPGPPRPTHRGSSTTRAGGPGVWVCSLGAQTRHSTCTKSTGPQLPRLLEAPAKACEAEKGRGGLRCPAAAHPSPGPVPILTSEDTMQLPLWVLRNQTQLASSVSIFRLCAQLHSHCWETVGRQVANRCSQLKEI